MNISQLTCELLCLTATAFTQRNFPRCLQPRTVLANGLRHSNTVCRSDLCSSRCEEDRGSDRQFECTHQTINNNLVTNTGAFPVSHGRHPASLAAVYDGVQLNWRFSGVWFWFSLKTFGFSCLILL